MIKKNKKEVYKVKRDYLLRTFVLVAMRTACTLKSLTF